MTVTLYADDVAVTGAVPTWVKDGNTWTYTFSELPKYSGGLEITYTVDEVVPTGYTKAQDGYDFVNSYNPELVSVSGEKFWDDASNQDGKRPESITIRLYADEVLTDEVPTWVKDGNTWSYTFSELPKNADGEEIEYTVAEFDVPEGYTKTQDGNDFVNSYTLDVTSVSGSKYWDDDSDQDGNRPESITVRLYANGILTGEIPT